MLYLQFDKFRKYDIFSNNCCLFLLESIIKSSFREISSKLLLMFTEETQYNTACVCTYHVFFVFYILKVPLKRYNCTRICYQVKSVVYAAACSNLQENTFCSFDWTC